MGFTFVPFASNNVYFCCPNFSTVIILDIDLKISELYTCFIINFSTRINQMYRGEANFILYF